MLHNNNSSLNSEIVAAIESGDSEQLRILTQSEDVLVDDIVKLTIIPHPDCTHTPLMTAAARGHYYVVHYLLWLAKRSSGLVDLDTLDENNLNAMMHAALGGHDDVVRILLKYGCDARILFQDTKRQLPPVSIAMLAKNAGQQAVAERLEKAADLQNQAAASLRDNEKFTFYKSAAMEKPAVEVGGKKRRVTFARQNK